MGKTGYFTHPDCRKHDMGAGHPECPERLDAIEDRLLISGVGDALERREATPAAMGELLLGHGRRHVAALRGLNDILVEEMLAGGPDHYALDPDTSMNQHTYRAALLSAGAAIDAVDAVMTGELENAFCCTRPPGHHATRNQAMGFCFFSNVAVAAKYACERHGVKRAAIIDFDVHHGNGTEDIFKDDPRVMLVSTFQHPFYPHSGADTVSEHIINIPLPPLTTGKKYREAFEARAIPALDAYAPEMIFISAGFDAHREDDMGQFGLVEADYIWITEQVMAIAERHAQGRIVSLLEGGYELSSLGRSVAAHVKALAEL